MNEVRKVVSEMRHSGLNDNVYWADMVEEALELSAGWMSMETAPRDGTMVRLLVEFTEHATEDSPKPSPTIGVNNFDNDGEDHWLFAGWCWSHDHFTQGEGTPVGWLPMLDVERVQEAEPVGIVKTEGCMHYADIPFNVPDGTRVYVSPKPIIDLSRLQRWDHDETYGGSFASADGEWVRYSDILTTTAEEEVDDAMVERFRSAIPLKHAPIKWTDAEIRATLIAALCKDS